jgi:hypothetical protein
MKIRKMIEKVKEKVSRSENENVFEMKYIKYNEIEDVYKKIYEMFERMYKLDKSKKYLERENESFGFIVSEIKRNNEIDMFMEMYLNFFKYLERNVEYEKEIESEIKNDKLFVCIDLIDFIYENEVVNIKRIRVSLLWESEIIYVI